MMKPTTPAETAFEWMCRASTAAVTPRQLDLDIERLVAFCIENPPPEHAIAYLLRAYYRMSVHMQIQAQAERLCNETP